MKWTKPLFDAIDQLRGLLPLAALAAVAGYTWWLVQSAPQAGDAARAAPLASTPDYELTGAMVERFDPTGARVTILRGSQMSHYLVGDRLAVVSPQLVGLDAGGQHMQAMARSGQYLGTDQVADLSGQARVVVRGVGEAQGPVMFEGESLQINTATRLLTAQTSVMLTSDEGVVRGNRLSHDGRTGITEVGGRAHGQLKAGWSP